jgi:hypothetical protein
VENKKVNKKHFKPLKNSGIISNRYSPKNSPYKDNQQNNIKYNFSIDKANINLIKTPNQNESKEISSDNSRNQSPAKSSTSKRSELLKIKKT